MSKARHIFHSETSGTDRALAWREATGEPAFVWGSRAGIVQGVFFKSVKREFQRWLQATKEAEITIYHDAAGVDALGPLDPCPQKVIFQHHWFPRWDRNFEWQIRCAGKALLSDPELVTRLHQRFSWIPERYLYCVPQPVLPDSLSGKERKAPGRRTGIWLHGRQWKQYGNRLRAFVDRWPAEAGELEIIVDGKGRPGWSRKDHLTWSAGMPLEFALYRLYTWDSTILLNDYTLDSPWLLQALALDCFPLVPDGEGLARTGTWDVDAAPTPYPWGDTAAAIGLLGQWRESREQLLPEFHRWRNELLRRQMADRLLGNSDPGWMEHWEQTKDRILTRNPPKLRQRKPVSGWTPVRWYERVQRLRAGV